MGLDERLKSEELRKKRIEFSSPCFHRRLRELKGVQCVNCGSYEGIEYHHIVPLSAGGTNKLSNIVPVCYNCHMNIHFATERRLEKSKQSERTGRPKRIEMQRDRKILEKYIHCEIGTAELKKELGLGRTSKITDSVGFKQFLKESGITSYRNNVDVKRRSNAPGTVAGYMIKDGEKTTFFF